jgi:hypothetical protein
MRSQPQVRLHTGYISAGRAGLYTRPGLPAESLTAYYCSFLNESLSLAVMITAWPQVSYNRSSVLIPFYLHRIRGRCPKEHRRQLTYCNRRSLQFLRRPSARRAQQAAETRAERH